MERKLVFPHRFNPCGHLLCAVFQPFEEFCYTVWIFGAGVENGLGGLLDVNFLGIRMGLLGEVVGNG